MLDSRWFFLMRGLSLRRDGSFGPLPNCPKALIENFCLTGLKLFVGFVVASDLFMLLLWFRENMLEVCFLFIVL